MDPGFDGGVAQDAGASGTFPGTAVPDAGPRDVAPVAGPSFGGAGGEPALAGSVFEGLYDDTGPTIDKDPAGTADRVRAARELADRFEIVDKDLVGPRLPNQVTQEEYDAVVKTYSDVRLGRGNVTLDGLTDADPQKQAALRQAAQGDVASLLQTPEGRELLAQLNAGRHKVRLGASSADGPTAKPDGGRYDLATNGTGTSATAFYQPGQPLEPGVAPDHAQRGDTTLFHELRHALDITRGALPPNGIDPASRDLAPIDREALRQGSHINASEYRTVGLGAEKNAPLSENRYRLSRALIGASRVGARAGDTVIRPRSTYATPVAGP